MTPVSVPQSTSCAESYPCFRDRCESDLRVVDAKKPKPCRPRDSTLMIPLSSRR
jgi:hypothetical protein